MRTTRRFRGTARRSASSGSAARGSQEYFARPDASEEGFEDGWLKTGDVVTVDEDGYIQLVDRTKDVIKSGGEWISSVELENAIMAYDGVSEATVVGVPHERWQERRSRSSSRPTVSTARRSSRKSRPDSARTTRNGGYRTRWSSSTRCPRPPPVSSRKRTSGNSTPTSRSWRGPFRKRRARTGVGR